MAGAAFPAVFPSLPPPVAQWLLGVGLFMAVACLLVLAAPLLPWPRRSDKRLALNAFLYTAELQGWVFKGRGHDALRLIDLLAQALADGSLVAWGRKPEFRVLVAIPAHEWRTLRIDLASVFDCRAPNGEIVGVRANNAATACIESGTAFAVRYTDLHLSGSPLMWLRTLNNA